APVAFFYSVLENLERLPDLESTLAGLSMAPSAVDQKTVTVGHTAKGIASLVCLKTTLKVLPAIVESWAEPGRQGGQFQKGAGADGGGGGV
ncbi:hypothetical protein TeGR_g11732, partial [Tetraparma gracilis]